MCAAFRRILGRPASSPLGAVSAEERAIFENELSAEERRIVERALPHSITSVSRLKSVIDAVRYCERRTLPGAFAECGVWRGGAVLAMLLTLQELGSEDRDVYLYHPFEGMTEPGEHDVSSFHPPARDTWERARRHGARPCSEFFGPEMLDEQRVRERLASTGYPHERLHFVRGPVEETIPQHAPPELALLRLDTDWYDSTRHELAHLYPRLCTGGVLLIDDYGHWQGARRAVDEYFATVERPVLLNRTDYTGRAAVKV